MMINKKYIYVVPYIYIHTIYVPYKCIFVPVLIIYIYIYYILLMIDDV